MPDVLRRGTRGEAVRDLQRRLGRSGLPCAPDDTGEFGEGTEHAVCAFQSLRSLRVDGIVGRQTWSSLVESGYALGDRLLYLRQPMLRGDDVSELQLRLNTLGFDAGREDGILGQETHEALLEFQRAAGLPADGICGATTIASLDRVGSLAGDSAAGLRERERLRAGPRRLAGRRVYVVAAPGLAVLGEHVTRGLLDAGANAILDATGGDDSLLAEEANRFEADLLLALRAGDASGRRCAYFAAPRFTSEVGHEVATEIAGELVASSRGRPRSPAAPTPCSARRGCPRWCVSSCRREMSRGCASSWATPVTRARDRARRRAPRSRSRSTQVDPPGAGHLRREVHLREPFDATDLVHRPPGDQRPVVEDVRAVDEVCDELGALLNEQRARCRGHGSLRGRRPAIARPPARGRPTARRRAGSPVAS